MASHAHPILTHVGTGWRVVCSCGNRTETLRTVEEATAAHRDHLPPADAATVAEALIAATPAGHLPYNNKAAGPSREQGPSRPSKGDCASDAARTP